MAPDLKGGRLDAALHRRQPSVDQEAAEGHIARSGVGTPVEVTEDPGQFLLGRPLGRMGGMPLLAAPLDVLSGVRIQDALTGQFHDRIVNGLTSAVGLAGHMAASAAAHVLPSSSFTVATCRCVAGSSNPRARAAITQRPAVGRGTPKRSATAFVGCRSAAR